MVSNCNRVNKFPEGSNDLSFSYPPAKTSTSCHCKEIMCSNWWVEHTSLLEKNANSRFRAAIWASALHSGVLIWLLSLFRKSMYFSSSSGSHFWRWFAISRILASKLAAFRTKPRNSSNSRKWKLILLFWSRSLNLFFLCLRCFLLFLLSVFSFNSQNFLLFSLVIFSLKEKSTRSSSSSELE